MNSRPQKRHNKVWRRRRCTVCTAVFTTTEGAALAESLVIADKGPKAAYQPFLRDKLFLSVYNSCQHRVSAIADATALTDTILSMLPAISQNSLVDRRALRDNTLRVLEHFDNAAAVHYAAFHKS
jgi:transcriptional regulator NrdR family protein